MKCCTDLNETAVNRETELPLSVNTHCSYRAEIRTVSKSCLFGGK